MSNDRYKHIYCGQAERYDRFVALEDYWGNLERDLFQKVRFDGAIVVEVGAGTGRLTELFAARAANSSVRRRTTTACGHGIGRNVEITQTRRYRVDH